MDCVTALENAFRTSTIKTTTMLTSSKLVSTVDPIKKLLIITTTTTMFTTSMTVSTVDSIKKQTAVPVTTTTKFISTKNKGCKKL
jgi:hypothetical protein